MLLVVDVGNTNIKLGIFDNDTLKFESRIATDRKKTLDQYSVELYTIFKVHNIECSSISGSIISSVVPQVTSPIRQAINMLTGKDSMILGPGVKTGLNIRIDNPSKTGSDLVAACVAAGALYSCPCIIIGMGTATTIVVIDEDKCMIGGALMPGVSISLNALTSTTALLPSVSFDAPEKVIGKNTEHCMQSGIVIGTACMLDGMIEKIEQELNQKCTIVATGGIAPQIVSNCMHKIILRDDLILEGLKIIYNKNK